MIGWTIVGLARFGYIMVAAGAAIGLGNIWKFPYLAYQGGGGIFLIVYIIIIALMAHPMVEMETAIGRHTGSDTVTCFQRINKKWGFVGWIANICTLLIVIPNRSMTETKMSSASAHAIGSKVERISLRATT